MSVEETIRKLIKEELKAHTSRVTSRIDALEREMKEKFDLVLSLRKYTLDQLQLEYRNLRSELSQESKDSNEDAEI